MSKLIRLDVFIEEESKDILRRMAFDERVSLSTVVRRLIKEGLTQEGQLK